MNGVRELVFRSRFRRGLWAVVAVAATGALLTALALAGGGGPAPLLAAGVLCLGTALAALRPATGEVRADAHGIHTRHRTVSWADVTDLRVRIKRWPRGQESRQILVAVRDRRAWQLPQPTGWGSDDAYFEDALESLRALHRRHGTPRSDRVVLVSQRTAGRGSPWPPVLCVLLLVCAGAAAWSVPRADDTTRAWESAVPCTASVPAEDRRECLTTVPAVIEATVDQGPKKGGRLYFADDRPMDALSVSEDAAQEFQAGDQVTLTVWRGDVMEVSGSRHVWREHVSPPGDLAVVAAVLALLAGYPAAQTVTRLRWRRLPDGEVLPSALPYAAVLAATAVWLLPLVYRHPTDLLDSSTAVTWGLAGTTATLALTALAWRATRVRLPGEVTVPDERGEVFVRARFLESTDYNPDGFGTHIALGGDGPPAVTPGPDRYGARTVPARRLTLIRVRRPQEYDGDSVPRSWHVAEFDDDGTPVRLAAAPADLARLLRALETTATLADASTPGSDR